MGVHIQFEFNVSFTATLHIPTLLASYLSCLSVEFDSILILCILCVIDSEMRIIISIAAFRRLGANVTHSVIKIYCQCHLSFARNLYCRKEAAAITLLITVHIFSSVSNLVKSRLWRGHLIVMEIKSFPGHWYILKKNNLRPHYRSAQLIFYLSWTPGI